MQRDACEEACRQPHPTVWRGVSGGGRARGVERAAPARGSGLDAGGSGVSMRRTRSDGVSCRRGCALEHHGRDARAPGLGVGGGCERPFRPCAAAGETQAREASEARRGDDVGLDAGRWRRRSRGLKGYRAGGRGGAGSLRVTGRRPQRSSNKPEVQASLVTGRSMRGHGADMRSTASHHRFRRDRGMGLLHPGHAARRRRRRAPR